MRFIIPVLPDVPVLVIHILAAVLPAAYLLRYIYRHDTVEKEPAGLLASLLAMGVLAAILSGLLEGVGEWALGLMAPEYSPWYPVLLAFAVVAVIEEGTKFLLLKARTWHHSAFNFRFDGVVYAVFVSLGFAAFENIAYVLGYGLSVAIARALLAVPGHMAFSVFMGLFYGRAKQRANEGHNIRAGLCLWAGYLSAVFLHGFYDACALSGTAEAAVVFLVFVLLMFLAAFGSVRRASREDVPVGESVSAIVLDRSGRGSGPYPPFPPGTNPYDFGGSGTNPYDFGGQFSVSEAQLRSRAVHLPSALLLASARA